MAECYWWEKSSGSFAFIMSRGQNRPQLNLRSSWVCCAVILWNSSLWNASCDPGNADLTTEVTKRCRLFRLTNDALGHVHRLEINTQNAGVRALNGCDSAVRLNFTDLHRTFNLCLTQFSRNLTSNKLLCAITPPPHPHQPTPRYYIPVHCIVILLKFCACADE